MQKTQNDNIDQVIDRMTIKNDPKVGITFLGYKMERSYPNETMQLTSEEEARIKRIEEFKGTYEAFRARNALLEFKLYRCMSMKMKRPFERVGDLHE